jgi:hypothetical protein
MRSSCDPQISACAEPLIAGSTRHVINACSLAMAEFIASISDSIASIKHLSRRPINAAFRNRCQLFIRCSLVGEILLKDLGAIRAA